MIEFTVDLASGREMNERDAKLLVTCPIPL